tara:strand:- start:1036 stop:1926 length:891 start_codon:yes stop_codon:yes gene_type:complete
MINVLSSILKSSRPKQWVKNFVIFLPMVFSFNESWFVEDFWGIFFTSFNAFVGFVLISSSIYLLNDSLDIRLDQNHPIKKYRPIASGKLSVFFARISSLIIGLIALFFAFFIGLDFLFAMISYLLIMFGYVFMFRNIFILDVVSISTGFIIRVLSGALAIEIPMSNWLYICTALGALFIALSKRYSEKLHSSKSNETRDSLYNYELGKLKVTLVIISLFIAIVYFSYTLLAENLPSNNLMVVSAAFVFCGLFRYLYLVVYKGQGEKPEDIIMKDIIILPSIFVWVIYTFGVLFWFR